MKVMIIGDSHTRAIKNYILSQKEENQNKNTYEVYWLKNKKGTHGELSLEDAKKMVSLLTSNDVLIFSILGTAHNIFGLLKHSIPFSFGNSNYVNQQQIIPINLMKDFYLDFMNQNKSIKYLLENAKCRVYHLSTPPPKSSNDFIESNSKAYREIPVNDKTLNENKNRLSMWQIETQALLEFCEYVGISFLEVPLSISDKDGFLKESFYSNDATHANIEYGREVVAQLEESL